MNRTVHRFCAYSGVIMLVLMGIGLLFLARFIPPPSPELSDAEIARKIIGNRNGIKWGLIVAMVAAAFFQPYLTEVTLQMRRIEGRYPVLALIQFGLNTLAVLEFLYLFFFWLVAAFRTDRSAELIKLLDDMGWVPFVGLTSTLVVGTAAFGVAILTDRRQKPVFPRWLGYFNLWCSLMFTPGSFNVFFKSGPLAWNGLIAFYFVILVFAVSVFVNTVYLLKAIDSAIDEEGADAGPGDLNESTLSRLDALQADVDRLLGRDLTAD